MRPEWYIGLGILIAIVVNAVVRRDAPQRHARYRMRAKLARWIYEDRLRPVRLRKVRRRGTAKRKPVLQVVRRDDQSA